MSFGGGYGMDIYLKNVSRTREVGRNDFLLFSESNSRFLVEVPEKRREDFEALMGGSIHAVVGRIKKEGYLSVFGLSGERVVDASLAELRNRWKSALGG
jgi:phosphoribosylformylglycinamidine synthase